MTLKRKTVGHKQNTGQGFPYIQHHNGDCFKPVHIDSILVVCCLTHSHTMTPFDAPGNKPFENTVGKGEIARYEQFLLFPQCFLPVWITFCHFRQT